MWTTHVVARLAAANDRALQQMNYGCTRFAALPKMSGPVSNAALCVYTTIGMLSMCLSIPHTFAPMLARR